MTTCRPLVNKSTVLPDSPHSPPGSMAFSIPALRISQPFSLATHTPVSPILHPRDLHLPIFFTQRNSTSIYLVADNTTIPTLISIKMEDFTLQPTTTTTTTNKNLYCEEQHTTEPNPQASNVVSAPNDQPFSINEAPTLPSPSLMSHHHTAIVTPYYLPSNSETLQFPYQHAPMGHPAYLYQVEGSGMGTGEPNWSLPQVPDGVSWNAQFAEFEEQRKLHLSNSKVARLRRKMARQRSVSLQINSTAGSSSPSLLSPSNKELGTPSASQKGNTSNQKDLYTFRTPDNKKLRILLQKELTSSDVGGLGRIVLPKREAEGNLPSLPSKEGIPIVIRNVYSTQEWEMRYRFWSNYKGRIYILDQIGDFVRQNRMENGDHFTLYEDESKNYYHCRHNGGCATIAGKKAEALSHCFLPVPSVLPRFSSLFFSSRKIVKPVTNPSNEPTHTYPTSFNQGPTDEEDTTLRILMQELEHTEQDDANTLMTL